MNDDNSNRIPKPLRRICSKSQLFGRSLDFCKGIPADEIASEHGVQKILDIIYKCDALSAATEVNQDFTSLLSTIRKNNESCHNYESHFNAQKTKLAVHGTDLSLHESMLALMHFSNGGIDHAHRILILASADEKT